MSPASPVPEMYAPRTADAKTRVRIGAGIIVRDAEGRILLERRSDCGWWGVPGGRVEPGESLEQAACREVFEETGLHVRIERLQGIYSGPENRIVAYSETDIIHLVDVVLVATIIGGELTISDESSDLQFFPPNALPAEIVPPAILALQDYVQGCSGVLR